MGDPQTTTAAGRVGLWSDELFRELLPVQDEPRKQLWRYASRDLSRPRALRSIERVFVAGIPIPDRLILTLAGRLRDSGFDDASERLEDAYDRETKVLALTIAERESTLRALEDCPPEFAELRGVLLKEHEWRVREGLV